MELMDAIRGRQSVGKMKSNPIPRQIIEELLDAAVQAPNHYHSRPWRFVVLTGKGREKFGDVMADVFHKKFPLVESEAVEKERAKPLRSPVVIAVGVDPPKEKKEIEIENVCAAAAACQNILLAAYALGLGGHWRTGEAASDPEIKKFLGFSTEQNIIAFLYIGYPEVPLEPSLRIGFEDRTSWIVY